MAMNIQPTLDLHPENHFAFAEKTDTKACGCCGFLKLRSKPKEVFIDENMKITQKKCNYRERILANQRLRELIRSKFKEDPIEDDKLFERLSEKINSDLYNGNKLSNQKIQKIVAAIHELKDELK